ncbi:MAG: MtnX-like HAD-IB family phosphatase [Sumerlaeia bacterium]
MIFVSDFDGTMTQRDFYGVVTERHTPPGAMRHWHAYENGEITHFEALKRIFAEIRATPKEIEAVLDTMDFDPGAAGAIADLRRNGWDLIVASAGCSWYIERLFARAGIEAEFHSNPGQFDEGGALRMELPTGSPFLEREHGIDKAAIVRSAMERDAMVAFAGDGRPDVEPALLVPPQRRFARGTLAELLDERGEPYQPYARWSDIVPRLLEGHRA